MKHQKSKDLKKRQLQFKNEMKQFILKSITKNEKLIKPTRWNACLKLTTQNTISYTTKIKKRCVLTNRKNIIHKNYKLSRLAFLNLARKGAILGIKKSTK